MGPESLPEVIPGALLLNCVAVKLPEEGRRPMG